MHIVVIGWAYVVLMMSISEESVVAGIATFLLYGLLPITIIVYLGNSKKRRKRNEERTTQRKTSDVGLSDEDQTQPPENDKERIER